MALPLAGCRVLVTRPTDQAEKLCLLIRTEGGTVIRFPTLEISVADDMNRDKLQSLISRACCIIFISRNAVRFAHRLSEGGFEVVLQEKKLIAVGDGTLRELARHNLPAISPGAKATSESLMLMPELDAKNVSGKNVLIVRGGAGREILHEALSARGARVEYANVYKRDQPAGAHQAIDAIWRNNCPDVIVITSEQGLKNLIQMTSQQDLAVLFSRKLVVISERLGESVLAAGFSMPAYVAAEQSDEGLLQAIRQTVE